MRLALGFVLVPILIDACVHPRIAEVPQGTPADQSGPTGKEATQAGVLQDRTFFDSRLPLVIRIQEGWVAQPGAKDGVLRLVLDHVPTGTRMEVWAWPDGSTTPRPRAGCQWTFHNQGTYDWLRITEPVEVGTCTPTKPGDGLVLGTYVRFDGVGYHFEAVIPPGRLAEAEAAIRELLEGVRFPIGASRLENP